jgi:ribosomal protein S18 acetylase RimI-like enzyme
LIREGVVEDAGAITRVHQRAWGPTYRGIVPDELIAAVTSRDGVPRWRERLVDPELVTFVAEISAFEAVELGLELDAPRVVGFACGGTVGELRQDDPRPAGCGLVHTLYLLPEVGRRGVGRALLEALHASFRERGLVHASLGVHPGNANARAFYERLGYRLHGDEFGHVLGGVELPTLEYRVAL